MAETKARASGGRSKANSRKSAKGSTRSRSSQAARSRTSNGAKRTSQRKSVTRNGVAQAEVARQAVEGRAKQAGHSIGEAGHSVARAARKAKTPLLAGGAALAGAAGGLALGARQTGHTKTMGLAMPRRPRMKVDSRDLAKAAREVGEFGAQVGQLASELRRTREEANGTKRRSPIEVVLQGLTTRGKA